MGHELYPDAVYRAGLKDGELRYQRCDGCGRAVFAPRVACPGCFGTDLTWQVSAGRGVVYAATTVYKRDGSYNVALIDLAEGFRMMSTVEGHPSAVIPIGLPVRCVVRGGEVPVFEVCDD
ncbi:Zn-ribbon domain-containing OB-fold protein [Nonomuraea terrae]|uniref:Zn-ribbon domain-containing OB-fold protein n=1 Tax=Nonomuraea terrae TaxID=2530383 RepID=UPI00378E0FB5